MQTLKLAKLFTYVAVFNGFLAFVFTLPILVPSLCIATPPGTFGCAFSMETSWPGTWLLVAYLVLISVGVLGMLGWGVTYYLKSQLFGKTEVNRNLAWLQLVLFEIGIIGATSVMAAIGFVGGNYVAHGGNPIVAAEVVRTQIIPPLSTDPASVFYDMPPVVEALFIALAVLGMLVGLVNFLRTKAMPGQAVKMNA